MTENIADAVADAVLGDLRDVEREDHQVLVHRCAAAHASTRDLLAQSVNSARVAGHSWSAIGEVLGMSRQAAQQRFGGANEQEAADERWLGPVTAFDEMEELAIAGRLGWRTVSAGMLRHRVVRTDTQWEHRRVVWRKPAPTYEKDGWQIGCRAFPWLYLVRDTGLPAETA
jgi:hypothetical protein